MTRRPLANRRHAETFELTVAVLVIETAITDNAPPFNQPWPPTGLGDGWHAVDKFSTRQRTFWRRIRTRTRAAVTPRASHPSVTHGECTMAFAKRKTGGGESFPLLKWDGRVGRLYTQDREQQKNGEWQSVQNDVTDGFCAVFDVAGVEHGYMRFPKGGAPETLLYPMGEDIGEAPEGENWQEGLRLRVKMPGEDFWRTLMSSAIGLWRSLSRLHDQYVEFAQKHPGKVPLVELIDVLEIKARTTSYAPTFGIIDWVDPDEVLQRPTEDQDEVFGSGYASGQPGKAKVAARGDMDDEIPW